ncbi:MAG: hypothetical protein ACJAVF_004780, partial [Paraglaciecola sp.]
MSKICVVVDDLKGYTRKWRRVQIYFNLFYGSFTNPVKYKFVL